MADTSDHIPDTKIEESPPECTQDNETKVVDASADIRKPSKEKAQAEQPVDAPTLEQASQTGQTKPNPLHAITAALFCENWKPPADDHYPPFEAQILAYLVSKTIPSRITDFVSQADGPQVQKKKANLKHSFVDVCQRYAVRLHFGQKHLVYVTGGLLPKLQARTLIVQALHETTQPHITDTNMIYWLLATYGFKWRGILETIKKVRQDCPACRKTDLTSKQQVTQAQIYKVGQLCLMNTVSGLTYLSEEICLYPQQPRSLGQRIGSFSVPVKIVSFDSGWYKVEALVEFWRGKPNKKKSVLRKVHFPKTTIINVREDLLLCADQSWSLEWMVHYYQSVCHSHKYFCLQQDQRQEEDKHRSKKKTLVLPKVIKKESSSVDVAQLSLWKSFFTKTQYANPIVKAETSTQAQTFKEALDKRREGLRTRVRKNNPCKQVVSFRIRARRSLFDLD